MSNCFKFSLHFFDAVLLYNGQNDQIVTYNKFIKAYTDQVLELSNNTDSNITTADLAGKIYSTHLNELTHIIGVFDDWITVGSALEWIGGAVIGLTVLIGAISAIIVASGEKISGLTLAIICAIIIAIIVVIGLAIIATGIILVSVTA
jgi:hypothetical protein